MRNAKELLEEFTAASFDSGIDQQCQRVQT